MDRGQNRGAHGRMPEPRSLYKFSFAMDKNGHGEPHLAIPLCYLMPRLDSRTKHPSPPIYIEHAPREENGSY